jgi:ribosome biogenesis GTPase / thiamine phosphate phosphatase
MSVLETLGWGPFFSCQLSAEESSTLWAARIVADRGPRLLARFNDADRLVVVPGRLKEPGATPTVGDFVVTQPGVEPPVVRVLQRRSALSRGVAGRATAEQVLAANVDVVLLVQGLDTGVKPRRLERTLAAVHASGARPVVVLTKSDLVEDGEQAERQAVAVSSSVPVVRASCRSGEGLDVLRTILGPGLTGVMVGASGAGKSTLLNALLGHCAQPTQEVRAADHRGRHTTTGRLLMPLASGGVLIDGPGIRELKLWEAGGIEETFDEIRQLSERCRFRDCRHQGEPGCAVAAAIEAGGLSTVRLASLQKLEQEAARMTSRRASGPGHDDRQRWRTIHKQVRSIQKARDRNGW